MTRIGDVGLFIGMILLFWQAGSFEYDEIFRLLMKVHFGGNDYLNSDFDFYRGSGKSGQFPLHTWLPDAMEGPTPVSALIHAATMVAAGVYLVASLFPLFTASETALMTIAVSGRLQRFLPPVLALFKRILNEYWPIQRLASLAI